MDDDYECPVCGNTDADHEHTLVDAAFVAELEAERNRLKVRVAELEAQLAPRRNAKEPTDGK